MNIGRYRPERNVGRELGQGRLLEAFPIRARPAPEHERREAPSKRGVPVQRFSAPVEGGLVGRTHQPGHTAAVCRTTVPTRCSTAVQEGSLPGRSRRRRPLPASLPLRSGGRGIGTPPRTTRCAGTRSRRARSSPGVVSVESSELPSRARHGTRAPRASRDGHATGPVRLLARSSTSLSARPVVRYWTKVRSQRRWSLRWYRSRASARTMHSWGCATGGLGG